ncbi:MAG: enoyl-CoA hydratase/isomerase family protein [Acidimicrobiia bacterium]|nr:enoyl-CoA hydratase/isomerase family protein [Acidimicrobiia bacterium]
MSRSPVMVTIGDDHVATVELCRPPNNFFSADMIKGVAEALEALDDDPRCRAVVLAAQGKHFCAGADFSGSADHDGGGDDDRGRRSGGADGAESDPEGFTTLDLYAAAVRVFRTQTPIVAAVQGAAVGGGLGLALAADFRVAAPEARFSANFARLGFHQGFGLSVTLPRLVGPQVAAELLYTGRRVKGAEAVDLGLADRMVPLDELRTAAHGLAAEIALSAPLAVRSIRATLRGDLADQVEAATRHEAAEQARLRQTADFAEGIRAMAERRLPDFGGR